MSAFDKLSAEDRAEVINYLKRHFFATDESAARGLSYAKASEVASLLAKVKAEKGLS